MPGLGIAGIGMAEEEQLDVAVVATHLSSVARNAVIRPRRSSNVAR
jgi:hypothetical protein